MNTGIYVRVSTEEQAINGFSVRAQIEKLKSYCVIKEWKIFDIYIDEGISGKNINERPSLLKLIDDIKNNNINNVLVYKIDRLTRSTKDLIDLIDLFNNYNCSFNSLTESIDTQSSTGRMFIKIIGIFAEFERETIVERVKFGLERKVKEGYTIANKNISFGYKKNKGQKIQTIDNNNSQIVKEIFELFLKGHSYSEIAKIINNKIQRGVTGLYGKGMFTNTKKMVLMCAVGRNDLVELKKQIKQIDSEAFLIVANSREVLGNWSRTGNGFPF